MIYIDTVASITVSRVIGIVVNVNASQTGVRSQKSESQSLDSLKKVRVESHFGVETQSNTCNWIFSELGSKLKVF